MEAGKRGLGGGLLPRQPEDGTAADPQAQHRDAEQQRRPPGEKPRRHGQPLPPLRAEVEGYVDDVDHDGAEEEDGARHLH